MLRGRRCLRRQDDSHLRKSEYREFQKGTRRVASTPQRSRSHPSRSLAKPAAQHCVEQCSERLLTYSLARTCILDHDAIKSHLGVAVPRQLRPGLCGGPRCAWPVAPARTRRGPRVRATKRLRVPRPEPTPDVATAPHAFSTWISTACRQSIFQRAELLSVLGRSGRASITRQSAFNDALHTFAAPDPARPHRAAYQGSPVQDIEGSMAEVSGWLSSAGKPRVSELGFPTYHERLRPAAGAHPESLRFVPHRSRRPGAT